MAMATASCFDPHTSIFTSPRPPILFPEHVDMVTLLLSTTSARSFHHRLAIADASTRQSLTFLQLHRHIRSAARALSFLGVHQHDVVLILSPNSIFFPVVFFAIISLGAVATTVNPVCMEREILKQVEDSKAKLILTVPELVDKVSNCTLPIVFVDDCEQSISSSTAPNYHGCSVELLSQVMKQAASHPVPPVKINQTDTAALLYSSGTTGLSKGVVLSHRNFIAASLQVNFDLDLHNETDLTFLCIIPMFHVYGLSIIVFGQLQKGNTLITMPKFDFMLMLEAIQTYHITNLPLVPPIMLGLAKQDVVQRFDLSSVIEMICGAAPIGKETLEEVYDRLKVPDIRQG